MDAFANREKNQSSIRLRVLAGLACALALVFACGAQQALAVPEPTPSSTTAASDSTSETASSSAGATDGGATLVADDAASFKLADDVFLAARTLEETGTDAKANLFASGEQVTLEGSKVGADLFAAGNSVVVKDASASNNAFLAGNSVDTNNLKAKIVFAAGNNLAINATAHSVYAGGSRVLLSGTYEGDVSVSAQTVIIDPNLVVKGTLEVSAPEEPEIDASAKIGTFKYNHVEANSQQLGFDQISSEAWLWSLLWKFLTLLITVVILLLVLRTESVDTMGSVVRTRPLATLITGLLALVFLPLIGVLLLISVVGWQASFAVFLCATLITVLASAITAISFGRLVMRKVNKWITSIIMVVLFALLFSLPYADLAAAILCLWYSLGLVIQSWWTWRRKPEGFTGSGDPEDSFDFPRGAHIGPSGDPISPTPISSNIPSSNTADYAPRSF